MGKHSTGIYRDTGTYGDYRGKHKRDMRAVPFKDRVMSLLDETKADDGMDLVDAELNRLREKYTSPDYRDGTLGDVIDRRVQVYGDPVAGFAEIAEMWTTYLGVQINAHQVPMMMILMKAVRSKTSPDYSDHIDDIKGYADIYTKVFGEDMIEARSVNEYIEKKWGDE